MKKNILIAVTIILLGLVAYAFVARKFATRESVQVTSQKSAEPLAQPSPVETIDTNDNLDQALQDLDQVKQF